MTVIIGTTPASPQGGGVTLALPYPRNQESLDGVRISNTSKTVIALLNNLVTAGQSQVLLFPGQQMVYPVKNTSTIPTVQALGGGVTNLAVTVEWSDDSATDFIGTYPASFTPTTT